MRSSFTAGHMEYTPKAHEVVTSNLADLFSSYMEQARATLARTVATILSPSYVVSDYRASSVRNEESELIAQYRWYITRIEAYDDLKQNYAAQQCEATLPAILIHPSDEEAQKGYVKESATEKGQKRSSACSLAASGSGKQMKCESCESCSCGIMPAPKVSMIQEEGVEFHYHTGVDGVLEYTAIVPGMEFKERVKFMKKHKDLFPEVPSRIMKSMGRW